MVITPGWWESHAATEDRPAENHRGIPDRRPMTALRKFFSQAKQIVYHFCRIGRNTVIGGRPSEDSLKSSKYPPPFPFINPDLPVRWEVVV